MSSRKRRKLDTGARDVECFGEVIAELDHEICLRRRVAETIESRITWALVLQEELREGSSDAMTLFKHTAFEAISAIEMPLDVLFTRDINRILRSNCLQSARPPRLPPKQKVLRNLNTNFLYIRSSDFQPPYDENHVQTYLLRCPRCLRKTFTSLQGLLNHARISHGLEWGTHDECVRACAVVDPEIDIETGIEVGLGPNGILPGLRSLFQMAVTTQYPKDPKIEGDLEPGKAGKVAAPLTSSHLVRTLGLHEDTPALAPFLGKQAVRRGIRVWGSGGEIVDIDGFCDKIQTEGGVLQANNLPRDSHRTWRMHFTHRNDFYPQTVSKAQEVGPVANIIPFTNEPTNKPSITVTLTPSEIAQDRDTTPAAALGKLASTGSRFHFVARVIVVDRSFWIPPERRPAWDKEHTHKWMISIESPSYSYHITTILKRLTVSSLSTPSSSSLTTTTPPFVVVGSTGVPFLAKVELCFSGTPGLDGNVTDQLMILEHWVGLDPLKSASPVVGDEQVVDVELDKGTLLLPIQKGYPPVSAKILWSQTAESLPAENRIIQDQPLQVYGEILSGIVGRFPVTLKGPHRLSNMQQNTKGRPLGTDFKDGRQTQPQLPYNLVPTSQFRHLVPGRRKAIEWSRARAIRDAYALLIRQPRFAAQDPVSLTTADVYSWLSEEGHFFRSPDASDTKREDKDHPAKDKYAETWYPNYSQEFEAHKVAPALRAELAYYSSTAVKPEAGRESEDDQSRLAATQTFPIPCYITLRNPKIPMVNGYTRVQLSLNTRNHNPVQRIGTFRDVRIRNFRGADLVATSDPNLTFAIHNVIRSLNLPAFGCSLQNGRTLYPLDELGMDRTQVENHIAPYAILATVLQRFVCTLIEGGLDAAMREKAASIDSNGQVIKKKKREGKEQQIPSSVLTPAHILNGVISRAQCSSSQSNVLDVALLECLARLGVPANSNESSAVGGAHGQADGFVVSVKEEEL